MSIGTRDGMSVMPSVTEWEEIFIEARRQGMMGITFVGVCKLVKNDGCTLPKTLLLKWSGCALQLKTQNERVAAQGERVLRHFHDAGFKAIILKGQSHLPNYPEHLRDYRAPGDIDVWVKGKSKKQVYSFVRKDCPDVKFGYIHIHYPVYSDTSVEVHIRPAYLCNPCRNHRLQKWADSLNLDAILEPSVFRDFNAIYQPLHLFKHLMREGITLRQLMDYYYLLKQSPYTDEGLLRRLGIACFCKDLQSVVCYLFEGLPIESETSRRLLNEVMIDFAAFGADNDDEFWRAKRVIKMYPEEILWRPYFWTFQKIWKLFF